MQHTPVGKPRVSPKGSFRAEILNETIQAFPTAPRSFLNFFQRLPDLSAMKKRSTLEEAKPKENEFRKLNPKRRSWLRVGAAHTAREGKKERRGRSGPRPRKPLAQIGHALDLESPSGFGPMIFPLRKP